MIKIQETYSKNKIFGFIIIFFLTLKKNECKRSRERVTLFENTTKIIVVGCGKNRAGNRNI